MPSRTVAIVTLYNPQASDICNIFGISRQCDITIVVDNSAGNNSFLFSEQPDDAEFIYVPNECNLGLSGAFNKCLSTSDYVAWRNDDYIVFFDQDTYIEPDHVHALTQEFERLKRRGVNVGCIGPAYFESNSQSVKTPVLNKKLDEHTMLVSKIITSSMLMQYRALKSVGFWSDDIFIDMADYDLCWKMRSHGYAVLMSTKSVIIHSIGEESSGSLLTAAGDSKPFREYYQVRDRLYLMHKRYVPLASKAVLVYELTLQTAVRLASHKDRKRRWHYLSLGVKHYRQGVHGAL